MERDVQINKDYQQNVHCTDYLTIFHIMRIW